MPNLCGALPHRARVCAVAQQPAVGTAHVYAALRSIRKQMAGESQTLWTIVNRIITRSQGGNCWFLIGEGSLLRFVHGVELHPQQEGQQSVLSFEIEDDGYGAILETAANRCHIDKLLTTMRPLSQHPLDSFSRACTRCRSRSSQLLQRSQRTRLPPDGRNSGCKFCVSRERNRD